MTNNEKHVRYGHPGHAEFNEMLKQRNNPEQNYDVVNRPWMSEKAQASLPNHQHDFLKISDPVRLRELESRLQTETERRGKSETLHLKQDVFKSPEDKSNQNSKMVTQDQPEDNLNPPPEMRNSSDHEKFNRNWLLEQRDAAMRANAEYESSQPEQQEPQIEQQYRGPEL